MAVLSCDQCERGCKFEAWNLVYLDHFVLMFLWTLDLLGWALWYLTCLVHSNNLNVVCMFQSIWSACMLEACQSWINVRQEAGFVAIHVRRYFVKPWRNFTFFWLHFWGINEHQLKRRCLSSFFLSIAGFLVLWLFHTTSSVGWSS
jgi:hypothetical protein